MKAAPSVDAKGNVTLNVSPNSSDGPSDAQLESGARASASKLKAYLTKGPASLRCAAVAAGGIIAATSFTAVFTDFLTLHPLRALINGYLVLFGLMVVLLETTVMRSCTGRWRLRLVGNAGFLTKTWGRGSFLFFVGTLCVAQHETLHTLVGLLVMALGIAELCVSSRTSTQLQVMRALLKDEDLLRAKFAAADANGDGKLSAQELAALSAELGSTLSAGELARSIELLDTDGDGAVSFEEWQAWMTAPAAAHPTAPAAAGSFASAASSAPPADAASATGGGASAHASHAAAAAKEVIKEAAAEMKALAHLNLKGHCALARASQAASVALCLSGALGWGLELLAGDFFTSLIDFYICLLAGAVACAETKPGKLGGRLFGRLRPLVLRNFKFMLKTWGRGAVITFCGTLAFGQLSSADSFVETLLGVVGIVATAVGVMTLLVGARAAAKLGAVKAKLAKQNDLREAFDKFDADRNGTLDAAELGALCAALGQPLNHDEMEEAVHTLDANRDGKVSYVEFVHWWQQGHDFSQDADGEDDTIRPGAGGAGSQQLATTGGEASVV